MNAFIHRLKHWQLFIVFFGIPFLFQLFIIVPMIQSTVQATLDAVQAGEEPPVMNIMGDMLHIYKFMPYMIVVPLITLFAWLWSIGVGLHDRVPLELRMNVKKFKLFLIIPMIYLPVFSFLLSDFMIDLISSLQSTDQIDPKLFTGTFILILPLHFFSVFCIFYCFYFAAKTLKMAELQRSVTFNDYAGEFFLFWFNVVGVWIIQPNINKLTSTETALPPQNKTSLNEEDESFDQAL